MSLTRNSSSTKWFRNWLMGFTAVIVLVPMWGSPASANPLNESAVGASVQVSGPPAPNSADLRDTYESRRMSGIVMSGILAPVFGGFTAMGTFLLYRHGREDGGGFCTVMTRDSDGDYRRTCEGDRGEVSGIVIVSTVGGILTLAMLVSGVVKLSRSSRQLRRLSLDDAAERRRVKFNFALSEREVSLGFSF